MSNDPQSIRLHKHIADQGIASRRAAEKLIAEGAVQVNGKIVTEMGIKINPDKDTVEVSETVLKKKKEQLIYILLNKPVGYVTTTKRTQSEPHIILDLLKDIQERVYPIGRLDKDSCGLLLLTNDGDLTYQLTHPSFEHEKEYIVEAFNEISDIQVQILREGVPMLGQKTLPPKVQRISMRKFSITLKEGKNRQIRRMFRKIGSGVRSLQRVRVGNLQLGNLPEGSFQILPKDVIKKYF